MDTIDTKLKEMARTERWEMPTQTQKMVSQTLAALPDSTFRIRRPVHFSRSAAAAAAVFLAFLLIPNISAEAAEAMEEIPVIGSFVRVITLRNYFYEDEYHRADIPIPEIEFVPEDFHNPESARDSIHAINQEVEELSSQLIAQFEKDMAAIGNHTEVATQYQVVTNNDSWFTLRIQVYLASGSGYASYKYYHIDKQTGEIVQLSDLFAEGSDYISVISDCILAQMKQQMEEDSSIEYWVDSGYPGNDFHTITENQNFFFDEDGNIVIQFDEYEVGPGSMNCPQFVVPREVFEGDLKQRN